MDETFDYLDQLSQSSIAIERNFINALIGSKDGAIYQARNALLSLGQMSGHANIGYQQALISRNAALLQVCNSIAQRSLEVAERLTEQTASDQTRDLIRRHIAFTQERLERDGERKVAQYKLDIKRIAIVARSMRDDNDWDASASLLRSRESVDIRSQQSLDALGKKQLTERFSRLLVRGLGVCSLTDSVMAMSAGDQFSVISFDGQVVRFITRDDYEELRESLFHPQCNRYLRPNSK